MLIDPRSDHFDRSRLRRPATLGIRLLFLPLCTLFFLSCRGSITTVGDAVGNYERISTIGCTSAEIELAAMPDGRLRVSGFASWCDDDETSRRGTLHFGELEFATDFVDARARHIDTIEGLRHIVDLTFVGDHLVVKEEYPDGYIGVHGLYVTFDGTYKRK